MKTFIQILILTIFLGCVSIPKNFINLQNSTDKTYGYSIDNPVSIGIYNNWEKNTDAMYYFLSKLQKDGHPLTFTLHASVKKPINLMRYELSPSHTGNQLMYNDLLDLVILKVKGKKDTNSIKLYFNVTGQNNVKIPIGLTFSESQNNNVFSNN